MGNSQSMESAESIGYGMGTGFLHKAYGPNAKKALQAIHAEVQRLECLLSRFQAESDITRINRLAGRGKAEIRPETYEVLAMARQFSELYEGAFDVTIGPLVKLWDYPRTVVPADERIKGVLPLVNHQDLRLEASTRMAGLRYVGQSIDLGAVGKGYVSDKLLAMLLRFGVTAAFSNLGGNVAVLGTKPDGSPWRIGIRDPRSENQMIGAVEVINQAVVTSADDQRYFIDTKGKRRHHLLDPATGYPADQGLISVTIVADSAAVADALATAAFVAGLNRARQLLDSFPGSEAVFVDKDQRVYVTSGLKERFLASTGTEVTIV